MAGSFLDAARPATGMLAQRSGTCTDLQQKFCFATHAA